MWLQMTTPFALPAQTSFESERSHHDFPGPSAEDAAESDYSDEESDPEQDATPRRSSRKRNATQASREGDDQVTAVSSMGCNSGFAEMSGMDPDLETMLSQNLVFHVS